MSDTLQTVRRIASDIFQIPIDVVHADSSPDTIESWDSTQHLNLILAIEEEFSIQLSPEEMDQMRNIESIVNVIQSKALVQ